MRTRCGGRGAIKQQCRRVMDFLARRTCVAGAGAALHGDRVELVEEEHAGRRAAGLVKDLAHLRKHQQQRQQRHSAGTQVNVKRVVPLGFHGKRRVRGRAAASRTLASLSPNHMVSSSGPLTEMKLAWHSLAMALASSVLPQPGGP